MIKTTVQKSQTAVAEQERWIRSLCGLAAMAAAATPASRKNSTQR